MAKKNPLLLDQEAKRDAVTFCERLLKRPDGTPLILHPKQVEMVRGIKPLTVASCGRQFGKSVGLAVDCTHYSVTHANRQVYIIAPTLDQSRIIFNEVARHFRAQPLAALVIGKVVDFPFPKIRLANGTEIHARGANSPQFIRGHHAHRIYLDEAAFFKEGVIGNVIEPMMTVAGKEPDSAMIAISTPFGTGEFKDLADACQSDPDLEGVFFHYSSLDNPHADLKRLNRIKARYGEQSIIWQTEYLANFIDDALAVFPYEDIKWAYENYPFKDEQGDPIFPQTPQRNHLYGQGVDLANTTDYFVASVGDMTNPQLLIKVRQDRLQRGGYALYKDLIRTNHTVWNSAETLVDATSLAESVVEDLEDINAEGYKFTGSAAKQEVVHELKRLMSQHMFVFPYNREMIDEYRFFQYEITPSKRLRMEAKQGHDDIVMADSLLAHIFLRPRDLGFFQAVKGFEEAHVVTAKAPRTPPHVPGSADDPFTALFE